ncbi:hypothetical protein BM221_003770 [Beauveria bassiana]|uniref:Uncharacterized protein n=1 Tax=Beauveria bassiana TaxID=176275 RepID=A0A2N6NVK8_BEABA|nr:hypothetical protein BM221_003770 [Beauveria bassiana]
MQDEVAPKPCLELAAQGIVHPPSSINAARTAYPAFSCGLVQPVQLASGRQIAHSWPSRALIELEVSTDSPLPIHHQQQQQQQQQQQKQQQQLSREPESSVNYTMHQI